MKTLAVVGSGAEGRAVELALNRAGVKQEIVIIEPPNELRHMSRKADLILALGLAAMSTPDGYSYPEFDHGQYSRSVSRSSGRQSVSKKERKKQKSKRRMAKRSRR